MKRLWQWLNWHPTGIFVQFGVTLALVVGGIFTYFSLIACNNEPSPSCTPGQLPPTVSPVSTHSSAWTENTTIIKPDMEPNITNTGSLYPTFGSPAERKLSWTGNQPARLIYSPPPGATGVTFPDPTKQPQPGGPPYVFQNPPQDIPVQFNFPAAPAGVTSWTVAETAQSTNNTGTSSVTLDTSLGITAALEKKSVLPAGSNTTIKQPKLGPPAYNALALSRWYWVEDVTMNTTLCQQIIDWLQSNSAFVALQVPVTFPTADPGYYKNPVLLAPGGLVPWDQPKIELTDKSNPVMNPIPLELRPERLTFVSNRLPAADGKRWLTVGVAKTPKAICPADLNLPAWEFFLNLPLDLYGNNADVPLYFCQEGQNPPPLGQGTPKTVARKNLRNGPGTVQADGITCIGPQPHSLATTYTLKFGNPAIVWAIKPPKTIQIFHELFISSYPVTLNFFINSQISGSNWELYWGEKTGPDSSKKINSPATLTMGRGYEFLWLVGTIPDGTNAGSYNVVVSAEKAGDPTVKASVTDLLWVDVWVPPPLPGGLQYIHLPVIMQKQ
jgi:hypothetical protein